MGLYLGKDDDDWEYVYTWKFSDGSYSGPVKFQESPEEISKRYGVKEVITAELLPKKVTKANKSKSDGRMKAEHSTLNTHKVGSEIFHTTAIKTKSGIGKGKSAKSMKNVSNTKSASKMSGVKSASKFSIVKSKSKKNSAVKSKLKVDKEERSL